MVYPSSTKNTNTTSFRNSSLSNIFSRPIKRNADTTHTQRSIPLMDLSISNQNGGNTNTFLKSGFQTCPMELEKSSGTSSLQWSHPSMELPQYGSIANSFIKPSFQSFPKQVERNPSISETERSNLISDFIIPTSFPIFRRVNPTKTSSIPLDISLTNNNKSQSLDRRTVPFITQKVTQNIQTPQNSTPRSFSVDDNKNEKHKPDFSNWSPMVQNMAPRNHSIHSYQSELNFRSKTFDNSTPRVNDVTKSMPQARNQNQNEDKTFASSWQPTWFATMPKIHQMNVPKNEKESESSDNLLENSKEYYNPHLLQRKMDVPLPKNVLSPVNIVKTINFKALDEEVQYVSRLSHSEENSKSNKNLTRKPTKMSSNKKVDPPKDILNLNLNITRLAPNNYKVT